MSEISQWNPGASRLREEQWRARGFRVWSPRLAPLRDPDLPIRISFCTTCMGRAKDIKQTLLTNIAANADYPHVEFVVLNYNSGDDLDDYMMSPAVVPHLVSGKVRYLRTSSPRYYSFAASRNIAFRHSTGELLINVDADNFTGNGFAMHLSRLATLCPARAVFARAKLRIHGRVGMYRNEFEDIGGYDEELEGYGYEDRSLMLRALAHGCRLMWWGGTQGPALLQSTTNSRRGPRRVC